MNLHVSRRQSLQQAEEKPSRAAELPANVDVVVSAPTRLFGRSRPGHP